MQKPTSVKRAELIIWLSLVASTILAVFERQRNIISSGVFVATLVLYALYCIIPYKIGRGSNWARYVYAILSAAGFALMLSSDLKDSAHFEVILAWVETPFTAISLYWLFKSSSEPWFEKRET